MAFYPSHIHVSLLRAPHAITVYVTSAVFLRKLEDVTRSVVLYLGSGPDMGTAGYGHGSRVRPPHNAAPPWATSGDLGRAVGGLVLTALKVHSRPACILA